MNVILATTERSDCHGTLAERVGSVNDVAQRVNMMDAGRRLYRLARSIEDFLIEQSRQLDAILDRCQTAATLEQATQTNQAEFALQQTAWERRKNEDLQLIEQERTKLGQEWVRLEAEQRRLLAEEALRRTQASTIHKAPVARPPVMSGETAEAKATPSNREETSPIGSAPAPTRGAILVEYEQLRSDVQKHARRRLRVT